jgi:hypothetical protein
MTADSTDPKRINASKVLNLLNCGFGSGLIQAFMFNPWDRALYLSIMHERPFLSRENFRNPMSGVLQTVMQRAISAGLYFPLEEISYEILAHNYKTTNPAITFVAGTFAGVLNGVIMNPFSRIKVSFIYLLQLSFSISFLVSLLGQSPRREGKFPINSKGNSSPWRSKPIFCWYSCNCIPRLNLWRRICSFSA